VAAKGRRTQVRRRVVFMSNSVERGREPVDFIEGIREEIWKKRFRRSSGH
jgi:hypothetical protein